MYLIVMYRLVQNSIIVSIWAAMADFRILLLDCESGPAKHQASHCRLNRCSYSAEFEDPNAKEASRHQFEKPVD